MSGELKSCPFCGGRDLFVMGDEPQHQALLGGFHVCCNNPGCQAQGRHSGQRDKAIAAWNTRPAPTEASGQDNAPGEGVVERVAKVLACANSSVDKEYDPELLWKCLDDRARAHWLRLARAARAAAGGKP